MTDASVARFGALQIIFQIVHSAIRYVKLFDDFLKREHSRLLTRLAWNTSSLNRQLHCFFNDSVPESIDAWDFCWFANGKRLRVTFLLGVLKKDGEGGGKVGKNRKEERLRINNKVLYGCNA